MTHNQLLVPKTSSSPALSAHCRARALVNWTPNPRVEKLTPGSNRLSNKITNCYLDGFAVAPRGNGMAFILRSHSIVPGRQIGPTYGWLPLPPGGTDRVLANASPLTLW